MNEENENEENDLTFKKRFCYLGNGYIIIYNLKQIINKNNKISNSYIDVIIKLISRNSHH